MEIRNIIKKDLDKVVFIHQNAFPDSFLTTLGYNFLKTYYSILLSDCETTFVGYYIKDDLAGFCSVANTSNGYNKRLIKYNFFQFTWLGLILLFSNPNSIVRLKNNLDKKSSENDNGDYSEIMSIAVSKKYQGKGIGKKMLFFIEKKLKENNFNKISLTTDYYDNELAIKFYKKNGYKVLSDFYTYPNRKMYRFIKILNNKSEN